MFSSVMLSRRKREIATLNEEGDNLWGAGFLGLDELRGLMGEADEGRGCLGELGSFINEIEPHAEDGAEYRVIFAFDN